MVNAFGKWFLERSLGAQLFLGVALAFVLWLIWATVGVATVHWYWTGSWPTRKEGSTVVTTLGQIGDLFGGINALFAAFAFIGVALAAYYQYRTYQLQRDQIAHQSFEPLFFQLLNRHQTPVNLRPAEGLGGYRVDSYGLTWFPELMQSYRDWLSGTQPFIDSRQGVRMVDDQVVPHYLAFYQLNEDILGPYFRKLYHIFKFIAKSQLPWPDKARYASIARAGLSKDEVLLLSLNCRTQAGRDFLPLVEGLGLLRHVSRRQDPTPDDLIARDLYSVAATMDTDARENHWKQHPDERPAWAV